jgi:hypothetical protein
MNNKNLHQNSLKNTIKLNYYLFYNTHIVFLRMCIVCVSDTIALAPGRGTNLRLVLLKPSGPEPAIFKKIFPKSGQ